MTVAQLKAPCKTCPYRRSVRLAFWSIEEYRNLEINDANLLGSMFNCHGEAKKPDGERRLCAGWLLDQRRRGVPSILLRLKLHRDQHLAEHLKKLKDMPRKLYSSIREMFEANYPGRKNRPMQPAKRARR